MEHESDGDTICNWCTRYSPQRIGTGTGELGNKRTSGDHPNYRIVEISQNTEKSPENLRRFAVTQTPVENQQLTLVWKTLKRRRRKSKKRRSNIKISRKTPTKNLDIKNWKKKQLYGYFKRQAKEITHKKSWTWLRRGNSKRITESLLKATQDNAVRISYVKEKYLLYAEELQV